MNIAIKGKTASKMIKYLRQKAQFCGKRLSEHELRAGVRSAIVQFGMKQSITKCCILPLSN